MAPPINLLERWISSSSALSPRALYNLSRRQDQTKDSQRHWVKGNGTIRPEAFNNRAIFVLFGFLGLGLVISAIWFFFWAKNGGFRFQKGDWEDYKSTVLRRKGKDGKTLSNATPRTNLGFDHSVRGEYDQPDEEMAQVRAGARRGRDDDVRRYRHEKPARVGGLNRKADGSYYDTSTNSEMSSEYQPAVVPPPVVETTAKSKAKKKSGGGFLGRVRVVSAEKKHHGNNKGTKRQTSAAYSFIEGDDSTVSGGDTSYLNEQRQQRQQQHHRQQRTTHHEYRRQASQSPRKSYHDNDTFISGPTTATTSYGEGSVTSGDTGTKSYPHHIPGLSKGGRAESPSYRDHTSSPRRAARKGGRAAASGGGGGRRRDSLSDSD